MSAETLMSRMAASYSERITALKGKLIDAVGVESDLRVHAAAAMQANVRERELMIKAHGEEMVSHVWGYEQALEECRKKHAAQANISAERERALQRRLDDAMAESARSYALAADVDSLEHQLSTQDKDIVKLIRSETELKSQVAALTANADASAAASAAREQRLAAASAAREQMLVDDYDRLTKITNDVLHETASVEDDLTRAVQDQHELKVKMATLAQQAAASEARASSLEQQLTELTTVTVINVETGKDEKRTLPVEEVLATRKRQHEDAPQAAAAARSDASAVIKKVKVERDGAKAKAAAAADDAEYYEGETGTMHIFSNRQTCTIERLVQLATELGGDPAAIKAAAQVR